MRDATREPVARGWGKNVLGWWTRRLRRDEGAAAVEFALLVPLFVMLVFGALTTQSTWTGTPPSGGAPAASSPCLSSTADPRSDDRVEVVIGRTTDFDAVFFHWTPRLTSRTVIVYERPSKAT